ncbi:ricin-type beta-trefoil lectin domain protein, partial [Streptosporangium sp. NPDC002544]|uniref:RICIN domain-containing protein n=1 Tax=Streptosporangium sp. NPDC002544 TaxID=3154538 RepID=UPI0033314344
NSTRTNGTRVHLWECANTNTNQKFVVDDGMIKVKDTLGSATPMCVDANSTRTNGTRVHLWECANTNTNQKFVVDDGMIKVKDTLA